MKTWSIIFVFLFTTTLELQQAVASKKTPNPIVTLGDLGQVSGDYGHTAWTKRKFMKFIDVPYGSSSHEGRFQPAQPVDAFDDVYDGVSSDTGCPSLSNIEDISSFADMFDFEDCLDLSIFTPNRTGSFPVMVYLAGFDLSDTENEDAEPDFLLEKDIVLVTVQFRGGPFGFLSTMTDEIPGNTGVLDVISALRFVQKYIKFVGGDPTRVTLFGQYGNAALIHLLTMSPLIEKESLFQRVIYQSGSALMSGLATKNSLEYAKEMGKRLECKDLEDVQSLNSCLKEAGVLAMLYAYRDMQRENIRMPFFTVGGPSGILPDDPKVLLEKGQFHSYPTMGGVVRHAAMGTGQLDNTEGNYNKFITDMEQALSKNVHNEEYRKIIQNVFPSRIFSKVLQRAIWPGVVDLHSLDVKESTSTALKYNAKSEKSYLFAFNYLGAQNRLAKNEDDGLNDVALTDDNIYLFPFRKDAITMNKEDTEMAKIVVDLWTSFATHGVPDSSHMMIKWPPLAEGRVGPYMKLEASPEIGYYYPDEFFTTVLDTRQGFVLE